MLDYNHLLDLMIGVVIDGRIMILLIVSLITLVLGICAAFKRGDFQWSRLSDFVKDKILGRVIPWLCLAEIGVVLQTALIGTMPDLIPAGIVNTAYLAIMVSFIAEGMTSLQELGVATNARPLLSPKPKRSHSHHKKPEVSQVPPLPEETHP